MIKFNNIDVSYIIKNKLLTKKWIEEAIKEEEKIFDYIFINLCSDQYLLDMNIKSLNHNYYTDIITFQLNDLTDPIEGDIYISIDRIKENAKLLGLNIDAELKRVLIHGVLHLCGYKDKDKKDKLLMTKKENYYLNKNIVSRGTKC
ncbi:MAG: rRNA maturation RNase YbeY [Bacteroidota bacterium]|jgi:rRNA maturation RNase YbeY